MPDFSKFAVIKTGWCDSYTGDAPLGNFGYFDFGLGAERFNMSPSKNGFQVYCITPAPKPQQLKGWTIAHVASDPADRKMKLIGWYEEADFLGREIKRNGKLAGAESYYCIKAKKAFEILPEHRPAISHNRQLGSTRLGWLRGEPTDTNWSSVRRQLERHIRSVDANAIDQSTQDGATSKAKRGDTARLVSPNQQLFVDDGGDVFGKMPGGESHDHRSLRLWAEATPPFFTDLFNRQDVAYAEFSSGTEHLLLSGDRVDAVHISDRLAVLIEAKSARSGEKDCERGIYQCVKYREVFLAMHPGYARGKVRAVLLTQDDISDRLTALAARLSVVLKKQPKGMR